MKLDFLTQERRRRRVVFQAADVKRPLSVVYTLTRAGNGVFSTANGGAIVNQKTKRGISFVRRGGVYILEIL
eukprot:3109188-Lingulodinium_polyedra.AAC.1